jgi:tRNA(fMet)-specific endonuclease VapC
MSYYVLDTDSIGFATQFHPPMMQRIQSLAPEDEMVTTIITFGEDLSGWLPACRRAPNGAARAQAYARLSDGLRFYREIDCLPFDAAAAIIFEQLRPLKNRIGTNDLSIAAIVLAVKGILITRNARDFQQVPDLIIQDWTT